MNKSSAITLGILAALGLGYTGGSWYIGKTIEQGNLAFLQEQEKEYPVFKVEEYNFKRGLLSSDESFLIAFPVCEGVVASPDASPFCQIPSRSLYIKVQNHYAHGPLPQLQGLGLLAYQSSLGIDSKSNPELLKNLPTLPALSSKGLVSFNGATQGSFSLPQYTASIAQNTQGGAQTPFTLQWQEISGDFQVGKDLSTVKGSFNLPLLSFTDGTGQNKFEIAGLVGKDDRRRVGKHVFAGEDVVNIERITFDIIAPAKDDNPERPVNIHLIKLASRYQITEQNAILDMLSDIQGDSLKVNGLEYGPYSFNTYLKQVKVSAFDQYVDSIQAINSPFKPAAPPADPQQLLNIIKTSVIELSQTNPSFGIEKLAFKLPGGDAQLTMKVSTQALTASSFENPAELLPKLSAEAGISVTEMALFDLVTSLTKNPQEAANLKQTFPAAVTNFINQGFVKREGNQLVSNASFSNQQLQVNGKPIPLPNLPQPH